MRPSEPRQLALALDHTVNFAREDFLTGPSNAKAVALIDVWPDWSARAMALVGPQGAGKTHLATVWAETTGARVMSAHALGTSDLPGALATGALVVEDVDPRETDERALFHLLNLARQYEAWLLLTARSAPANWPMTIRDVGSRLRALPVATIDAPDDALLRALIIKLCADRQLAVDEALVGYLATRLERSFSAVQDAIARLDTEAMRQRRPVTRVLAAELLRAGTA